MTIKTVLRAPSATLLVLLVTGAAALAPAANAGSTGDRRACVLAGGGFVNAKSNGVVSAINNGSASYTVKFNKIVGRCVKVATIGSCDTTLPRPGEISVADVAGAADSVRVRTFNSAGVSLQRDFHLYVDCD